MDIEITENYDSSKVRKYEPRANINISQEGGRPGDYNTDGQRVIKSDVVFKAEGFRNREEQLGSFSEEQGSH